MNIAKKTGRPAQTFYFGEPCWYPCAICGNPTFKPRYPAPCLACLGGHIPIGIALDGSLLDNLGGDARCATHAKNVRKKEREKRRRAERYAARKIREELNEDPVRKPDLGISNGSVISSGIRIEACVDERAETP